MREFAMNVLFVPVNVIAPQGIQSPFEYIFVFEPEMSWPCFIRSRIHRFAGVNVKNVSPSFVVLS